MLKYIINTITFILAFIYLYHIWFNVIGLDNPFKKFIKTINKNKIRFKNNEEYLLSIGFYKKLDLNAVNNYYGSDYIYIKDNIIFYEIELKRHSLKEIKELIKRRTDNE